MTATRIVLIQGHPDTTVPHLRHALAAARPSPEMV